MWGLITTLIGYGLYRSVINRRQATRLAVISVAAWLSVMGAALATSLQLWLSGTVPLDIVIPAMMSVHALIGIGEALITVAAVSFILRTRPEILDASAQRGGADRGWIIGGAIASLIVVVLSPLASADPDGLERVAEDIGFISLGQSAPYEIIPDYTVPFLGETPLSTIVAGIIGALVVAVVVILVAQALRSRRMGVRG
ncbi:MAG: energy-coupling factor ABC transporter permease [Roseiflexaceae bacterium]|nr:energy-coupling factor ABC transporter permease [Roseiflexaceae bacterium]